ncbi:hypothetical protein BDB00DRAFT_927324 [Zychaea mexicana]|uniref:uncharacterized protein n=1 Tax=Zychaea mexicana TaxID=64656 RepID=UPI0022FEAB5C|nr:uncharacterized protein BDB00DRAFT_927324 [Zychaea mexicana]KAI9495721.1 hypothetical protein BDB00DRAFT_927324 [Zychaea mexicana]
MWINHVVRITLATAATAVLAIVSVQAVPDPGKFSAGNLIAELGNRSVKSHRLDKRDVLEDFDHFCPAQRETHAAEVFSHFTGVFFGDFITGGAQDILGPLAVGGAFTAPNYLVNANHALSCSGSSIVDRFGLVIGGEVDTYDTRIRGSVFYQSVSVSADLRLLSEGEGCSLFTDSSPVDFDVVESVSIVASLLLSSLTPNVQLNADGTVNVLDSSSTRYSIFTFNTCSSCDLQGTLSDPSAIFFNQGNWNGPQGGWSQGDDELVVFNIPVLAGSTVEINSNNPSNGFNACKTIYNIYPVNLNGEYSVTGEITFIRNTASQLEGFSLAPQANVLDGTTGAFAGNIIGLSYGWRYYPTGVEIHDYAAAGDGCDEFQDCLPGNGGSGPGNGGATTGTTTMVEVVTTTYTSTAVAMTTMTYGPDVGVLTLPSDYTFPPDYHTTFFVDVDTDCEVQTTEVTVTEPPTTVTSRIEIYDTETLTSTATDISTQLVTNTLTSTEVTEIVITEPGTTITVSDSVITVPPETVTTEITLIDVITTTDTSLITNLATNVYTTVETLLTDMTLVIPGETYTTAVETLVQVPTTETFVVTFSDEPSIGTTEYVTSFSEPTTMILTVTDSNRVTEHVTHATQTTRTITSYMTQTDRHTDSPMTSTTRTKTITTDIPGITVTSEGTEYAYYLTYPYDKYHGKGKKKIGKWNHGDKWDKDSDWEGDDDDWEGDDDDWKEDDGDWEKKDEKTWHKEKYD